MEAAKQLAIAEQVALSNALFDELIKEEKIDGNKFKSYLELVVSLGQQKEAVLKIQTLPVNRLSLGLVGQMTAFVKTLDKATKETLKNYLLTNSKLNKAVSVTFK